MRTTLIVCLMLLSSLVSATQVSIDCSEAAVDAVIADIARQSGETMTVAAATDMKVTAKVTNVSVEDALKVVSDLCSGIFIKTESGYRVYPKTSPGHVLGLVRGMYSRIKDIETFSESIPLTGDKTKALSKGHSCWKYPRYLLSELESTRVGTTSKTVSVCDGEFRWSRPAGSSEITKRKVSETKPTRLESIPVGVRGNASETLANLQADQLPNLRLVGVEVFRGRAVYALESEDEPVSYEYGSEPSPEKSGMAAPSGNIRRYSVAPETEYCYTRPEVNLDPPSETRTQKVRFGVDADTGLVVYNEYSYGGYITREEASDIREAAPGIPMPFYSTSIETAPGKEPRVSREVKITAARVNVGQDDKVFSFSIPPHVFICDMDLDLKTCEEALKSSPNDRNLLYRHAQLLRTNYDPESAAKSVQEYDRALALLPEARRGVLRQVFQAASASRNKEVIAKYAAELLNEYPDDRDVGSTVAYAYRNADMKEAALEAFGKLCATYENRAEAPLDYVASICHDLGDKARAERLYVEILKISDEQECRIAAQALMGICISEKRPESARAPLESALKRFPGSQDLRYSFGFLLSTLNEPDLAMAQFRELARIADEGYLVAQAIRQLKSQRNYGSAKEIGTVFLSRQDVQRGRGSALSEMAEIYKLENVPVDKVISAYREFAGPDGDAASTFRMMFSEKKVLPEAIEQVMAALKADPNDRILSRLLLELVDPGSSALENAIPNIAAMKQLIVAFPDQAPLYGMLGEVHRSGKDYPEAGQAFRKGIELAPDQPYYYASLASIYTLAGEHDKACEMGRQLVDRDSDRYDFRCVLGSALANAGKNDEAVVQFRKADELIQVLPLMSRQWVSVLDALILCYTKLNDNANIEQCLVLKVDRAQSGYERASSLQYLAMYYAKQDQHDKAVAALVKIEKGASKAELANVGYNIQNCKWQVPQEKRSEFTKALESVLSNESELINCKMLLAGLYIEQKNMVSANAVVLELAGKTWDDESMLARVGSLAAPNPAFSGTAVKIYTRLVALNSEKPNYGLNLARAYQSAGMCDKALTLARKLVRDARNTTSAEPSDLQSTASIAVTCAHIFRDCQMLDECIDAFNAAVELKPDNQEEYEMSIAGIYNSKGDKDSAVAIYERIGNASKDTDRRVAALMNAASIYEGRQQNDRALECWKKVLLIANNPSQKEHAQSRIDRLTAPPTDGNG